MGTATLREVEQIVRDARIAQIYEGANGIQALDLAGRKVVRDGGKTLTELLDVLAQYEIDPEHQTQVTEAFARLLQGQPPMVARSNEDANLPGAVSSDFLMGMTLCAWAWGVMAHQAGNDDFGLCEKTDGAGSFLARLLPRTLGRAKHLGQFRRADGHGGVV